MVESDHSETGQDVTSTNATRQKDSIDKSAELSGKRPREGCIEDDKIELPNKKSRSEMDEQSSTLKEENSMIPESNGNTMIVDEDKNSQGNGEANLKSTDDSENRDNVDASSADMETQEESQEEKSEDEKHDEMEKNQDAPDSACEDKDKMMEQDEVDEKVNFTFNLIKLFKKLIN